MNYSVYAAPYEVKYRSWDRGVTPMLGGSTDGTYNGFTYENFNFNAGNAGHTATYGQEYTVLGWGVPGDTATYNDAAILFHSFGGNEHLPNIWGYRFTGRWRGDHKKDGTSGSEEYGVGDRFTYKVNGDLILEAILEPEEYTITYDCGGFSYNGSSPVSASPRSLNQSDYEQTVIFDNPYRLKDASDVLNLCNPPVSGYVFKGWMCKGSGNNQHVDILEYGENWPYAYDVDCVAQWALDSKSSVIHLLALPYNGGNYTGTISYTQNPLVGYNSQLGRTEILSIKNNGVYIDLNNTYEMIPVGSGGGAQNPVAIPSVVGAPYEYFLGYFGVDSYTSIGCEVGDCFFNGNRYINSYGELTQSGQAAGIGYDTDAVWAAGWANIKSSAMIKLDSSDADMGYHGQEFLFFEPVYSNTTPATIPPAVDHYNGPYLNMSSSGYSNSMTTNSHPITVNSSDFKRSGYTFAGYFSIADPGPEQNNIGTRYIDKNGYLTNDGMNYGHTGVWYAHWCQDGFYTVDENGKCQRFKGYEVTYDCDNNNLGTVPEDNNGYFGSGLPTDFIVTTPQSTCLPPLGKKFSTWNCNQGIGDVSAGDTFTISADTTCTAVWEDLNPCGEGYEATSWSWLDGNAQEGDINWMQSGSGSEYYANNQSHFDDYGDIYIQSNCASDAESESPLVNNIFGAESGNNCWCNVNRYYDQSSSVNYSLSDTLWFFGQVYDNNSQCDNACLNLCLQKVRGDNILRRYMYMSAGSCGDASYNATYLPGNHGILSVGTGVFVNDMTHGTDYSVRGIGTDIVNGQSGIIANTGYEFGNWLASDGNEYSEYVQIDGNDIVGGMTFTAQWNAQCNGPVTLDANKYNSSNPNSILYEVLSNPTQVRIKYNDGWYSDAFCETAATVTAPTLDGYTFGGYYTNKESTGLPMTTNVPALTAAGKQAISSATWYAKWTPKKYTVIYDYGIHAANGATGTAYTHNNGATYDADYAVPAAANNAITAALGYEFVGWNTSSGETEANFPGNSENPWVHLDGITVYAAYRPNTIYLKWIKNGGALSSDNPGMCFYGTDNGISPINNPTRDGYKFTGWTISHQ